MSRRGDTEDAEAREALLGGGGDPEGPDSDEGIVVWYGMVWYDMKVSPPPTL